MPKGNLAILIAVSLLSATTWGRARPDQVLVVYNADWREDQPGTEPGQDSRELAEYYVARRTDPRTGRKPYLLGLRCAHGAAKDLNAEAVAEASADNYLGVVYTGSGRPLASKPKGQSQAWYLLSNRIECRFPAEGIDRAGITLSIRRAGQAGQTVVFRGDRPAEEYPLVLCRYIPASQRTGKAMWLLGMDAKRAGFDGDLSVRLLAAGADGKVLIDETARYFDPEDFAFSATGPDGLRDDQHYLQDVENPIKAFLEDPANAVNGRPLKEHILYIVLCHGLPRTVRRTYGIAQSAVPASYRDSGNLVSLGGRLEMAYYDLEAVRPPGVMHLRLNNRFGAFQCWVPVASYYLPLAGPEYQPYLHPSAYGDFRKNPKLAPPWQGPTPFTSESRSRFPRRFLYLCSRLDAARLEDAKHQIDAAEYAEHYLTRWIGSARPGRWDGAAALAETADQAGAEELKRLGLPGSGASPAYAAYFGRRPAGGYLPGGIDWHVNSGNSCASPSNAVRRMLREQVAVTGGAVRAYHGCPHTTTHAWWDARVFYHFLFRGYDLGEAWLSSRHYCQWVTAFFGDPLYCPDLRKTRRDTAPPQVAEASDINVEIHPAGGQYAGILRATLRTSPENPELVTTAVEYWPEGGEPAAERRESTNPRYSRRPRVVLRGLAPQTTYHYRLVLTDPYGNRFDSTERFGVLSFATGPALPVMEPTATLKNPERFLLRRRGKPVALRADKGEIRLSYQAGTAKSPVLLRCGELVLRQLYGRKIVLQAGGGHCVGQYGFQPGRTYRIRLRYRRFPLTREVWLLAADGSEFLLCADNHLPWRGMQLGEAITFAQSAQAGFVREAIRPRFDAEAFERADQGADAAECGEETVP